MFCLRAVGNPSIVKPSGRKQCPSHSPYGCRSRELGLRVIQTETANLLEIDFKPDSNAGETEVREVMKTPFGKLGQAALALIGKFPASEIPANLQRFKQVMETGKMADTSYSVPGKFRGVTDNQRQESAAT